MDGNFARNLPVGKIMAMAVIGFIATVCVGVGGLLWLIWFVINHVRIV
jgi:hypothetical protein